MKLIDDIKHNMKGWFLDRSNDLFPNILQVEQVREVGFLSNSFVTIDLKSLQESIKS